MMQSLIMFDAYVHFQKVHNMKKPYVITPSDIEKITNVEMAFGATALLPKMENIPDDFSEENKEDELYFKIVNALFYNTSLPQGNVEFKEGFEPEKVICVIRAHLASWDPKHEHKTIGVAYMLKCMCTITPINKKEQTA